MDLGAELLLNLQVYLALAAAAAVGIAVVHKSAGTWLPLARLRRGSWSGSEVILCLIAFPLITDLLMRGLDETGFFFWLFDKHVKTSRQANVIAVPLLILLFYVYIRLLHAISGTYAGHVGLTPVRWRANVRLGLAGFVLATPVVLGVYALALLVTQPVPHVFEELARENLYPWEWALLAVNAIVVAPLLEEWLFRGLVQGWLRRASPLGHLLVAVFTLTLAGGPLFQPPVKPGEVDAHAVVQEAGFDPQDPDVQADFDLGPPPRLRWEAFVFACVVVGIYAAGVLRIWWPVFNKGLRHFVDQPTAVDVGMTASLGAIEGQSPLITPHGPRWDAFKRANARWSILGSAMLFAFLHPAWPSSVALLPLGLVLGWLAYRTQSLLPGMVLHALFNAVATAVLYLSAG